MVKTIGCGVAKWYPVPRRAAMAPMVDVARAHSARLSVWHDAVAHGGSSHFQRFKDHPEWLTYRKDGKPTWTYWCADFNWPTWIDYMSNYVEGCTFRRTGGAPLRFIADYRQSHWCEGTGSRNLVVRDCLFEDCAVLDGAAPQISAMCVTPAGWDVGAPPKGFVGGDARIENNRFVRPSGPVVDMPCGSVSVQSSCTRAGFEIANSSSQNQ